MFNLLIVLGIVSLTWFTVTSIIIYDALRKRGMKTNFIFIRFMMPVYADRYKKLTLQETGKTGPLFYHWIISIWAAFFFFAAALISHF